jgi:hypothetical protein
MEETAISHEWPSKRLVARQKRKRRGYKALTILFHWLYLHFCYCKKGGRHRFCVDFLLGYRRILWYLVLCRTGTAHDVIEHVGRQALQPLRPFRHGAHGAQVL